MTEARERSQDDPSASWGQPRWRRVQRNEDNCLNCDLLVVDEASMIDVLLMQAMLKATHPR
jgi:exodeoxyribonuclease V alpha subunit